MSSVPSERRSWGALIATIDLLFLVVAFFTLLLFFVQKERSQTSEKLDRMQTALNAALPAETADSAARGNPAAELVDRLMGLQQQEQDRQKQRQLQEERRRSRPTVRVGYVVLSGPRIEYEGRTYTLNDFLGQVVTPLRKENWLALRAYARAETRFGDVVATRKLVLERSGEFDTYWDNLKDGAVVPAPNR